ncbi:MAG: hypothetical protein GX424_08700 [Clostridiales bacterium]|nr:hypothetical protein [Clostridiales bacterium]
METENELLWIAGIMQRISAAYRLAFLYTLRARSARAAAGRAILSLAAEKPGRSETEQKDRLFRLALAFAREQKLRALFRGEEREARPFFAPEQEAAFAAVAKLSKTNRIILYLYYEEDYDMARIAGLLHRRERHVAAALKKSLAALNAEPGGRDWESLLPILFRAVQPEEALRAEIGEQLAQGKRRRGPAVQYAAAGVLALLVLGAFVAAPLLESRSAREAGGAPADSGAASQAQALNQLKQDVRFSVVSYRYNGIKSTVGLSGEPAVFSLSQTNSYSDDTQVKYSYIYDFGLQYDGPLSVKRVTYTACNCRLMKKVYFGQKQYDSGEAFQEAEGSITGCREGNESEYYFGYTSMGYVYSADPDDAYEQINLAVSIPFQAKRRTEQNSSDLYAEGYRTAAQAAKAFQKACDNACIQVEVLAQDGTAIRKTIRFGHVAETNSLTARVTE